MSYLHVNERRPLSARAVKETAHASFEVAETAAKNERVTRQRVDNLEAWAGACTRTVAPISDLIDYLDTGLWARLRWLWMGNAAITPKRTAPKEDAA